MVPQTTVALDELSTRSPGVEEEGRGLYPILDHEKAAIMITVIIYNLKTYHCN